MLSGVGALSFEILLFRRLAVILGQSVWATATVSAAYMLGLAVGALLVARRPVRTAERRYAAVEGLAALSALGLVLFAAPLAGLYAQTLGAQGSPYMLVFAALILLLLPTVAMGMALPLLSECAMPERAAYQARFARLFAANTVGALLGVSLGYWSLRELGVPVTAAWAAAAHILAGTLVMLGPAPPRVAQAQAETAGGRGRWLWAAALCGAALLGLEVVVFRVIRLFVRQTDLLFAVVVATVVAGLALGAAWSSRRSQRSPASWFLGGAGFVIAGYGALEFGREIPGEWSRALILALIGLGLPAFCSGVIFADLARAIRGVTGFSSTSSGTLLAANSLGAALGGLAVGLLLLPTLGPDLSWVLMAILLLLGALLIASSPSMRRVAGCGLLSVLVWLAWRPPDSGARWAEQVVGQFPGYVVLALRHGPDATHQLAERRRWGQPVAQRLITDGYSMSGTEIDSLRYMRLFALWPLALRPDAQSALLISYGLGNTAEALLAGPELTQLTVVDTSAATLELSRKLARPDPLVDPRTRRIIEDGRQFLLRTRQRFDIITAEPPPPRLAGVTALYSREYFALVRGRLRAGGIATHWLPVDQLSLGSSAAILRAFCAEFADCSLWAGSHYNWMMIGTRALASARGGADLAALWRIPRARRLLEESGLELPAQLATTFIADAEQIARIVGPGPQLLDDYPGRLASRPVSKAELDAYFLWMDDQQTERRFYASNWIARVWPLAARARARDFWLWQPILNGQVSLPPEAWAPVAQAALAQGLRQPLRALAQVSGPLLRAARLAPRENPEVAWVLGVEALSAGRMEAAQNLLSRAEHPAAASLRDLSRCLAGKAC